MKEQYVKAKFNEIAGKEFNGNLAIMYLFSDKYSHDFWVFRCPYCKNFFIARLDLVKSEKTKSCGCLKNRTFRENVTKSPVNSQIKRFDSLKKAYCSEIVREIKTAQGHSIYKTNLDNIHRDREIGLINDSAEEKQILDLIRVYKLSQLEQTA